MIDLNEEAFPLNIVLAVKQRLAAVDPDIMVFTRPLRVGDPVQAWSVMASLWTPDNNSWEFLGEQPLHSPTLNQYIIGVQALNQHMDSEVGLQVMTTMASITRNILSRDAAFHATLANLRHDEFGFTEVFKRSQIMGQRLLSNEIERTFYSMSNLEFMVETEIH